MQGRCTADQTVELPNLEADLIKSLSRAPEPEPVEDEVMDLIATDEKRLHTFEELRHATEGWISATSENMTLHVDMKARKTAPFPPDIAARIHDVVAAHGAIPQPDGIGRRIAMLAR